ncbi:hypothetical protein P692DRAFT_20125143 [Suillus brevipes Sb2]|nr:hypothetical protein P692DRAFT_20125143 [Suillus brevipes Sb2]
MYLITLQRRRHVCYFTNLPRPSILTFCVLTSLQYVANMSTPSVIKYIGVLMYLITLGADTMLAIAPS